MSTSPIGIIDSGIGGLSVMKSIIKLLPYENVLYFGDHAHLPYGNKTQKYIRNRIIKILKYLNDRDIKICVLACNAGTVAGIEYYRKQFPKLPIVGIVPVIKTAVRQTRTGYVAVLTTVLTQKSSYLHKLIKEFAGNVKIISVGCPNLVNLIESAESTDFLIHNEVQKILNPLLNTKVDVVVLGCTHYPLITSIFRDILDDHIQILDSGDAVAKQVNRILLANGDLSQRSESKYIYETTGNESDVSKVAVKWLNQAINFQHVNL
jgi:glutamate racemase